MIPNVASLTPEQVREELDRMRAVKNPTRRGVMLCTQMLGQMLQLGWPKETMDSFEILFWATRDGNGEMLKR